MDRLVNSLYHFGNKVRGYPPLLSPTLDDFEFTHYIRQTSKEEFRILLNVQLFNPCEVQVDVIGGSVLQVRAKHDTKLSLDGIWMKRDCTYSYVLPKEVRGKALHAEWSEDGYLLVQANSEVQEEEQLEGDSRVRLIPERVTTTVRPIIELAVVRELIEEVRNKVQNALRYIRFYARSGASEAERQVEDRIAELLKESLVRSKSDPQKSPKVESENYAKDPENVVCDATGGNNSETDAKKSQEDSGDISEKACKATEDLPEIQNSVEVSE